LGLVGQSNIPATNQKSFADYSFIQELKSDVDETPLSRSVVGDASVFAL
jgi:hypothetical protein